MKLFIIESYGFYRMDVDVVISNTLSNAMNLIGVKKVRKGNFDSIYNSHLEFPTRRNKEEIIHNYCYDE